MPAGFRCHLVGKALEMFLTVVLFKMGFVSQLVVIGTLS